MAKRGGRSVLAVLGLALLSGAASATWPAQRQSAADLVRGSESIFADGFESGDFTAWDRAPGAPPGTALPPDPAETAPNYDPTVAIDPYEPNIFIFEGSDPIQFDVDPGAIDPRRICLVRGRVLDRAGEPVRGVRVTIHDAEQLGFTFTRPDGVFDLAVNGGGNVGIEYRKNGFLPAFRTLQAPAADWAEVENVVMIELDPEVTEITSGMTVMQVARGSLQTDADGSRQATTMFPAGTTAEMILPDGTTVPLSALNVRATEYTVGETGPASMPADLPVNSAYTYAVEFSADEAIEAGAVRVDFSEDLSVYLENFLDLPVGEPVPAGYFDRERGEWVAAPNGLVLKVLSITGGMADLDVDGSGTPADPGTLSLLGITDAERTRLAVLYGAGQELWRVRVGHFTPWDFNWPYGPPPDAELPPDPEDVPQPPDDPPAPDPDASPEDGEPASAEPDCVGGSIIECQNQILRESIALVGVPYRLHYSSDRFPGRTSRGYFKLRLSGATIPASLQGIRLNVVAAGRSYWQSFGPIPDLVHTVEWERLDRFGRPIHAETPVTIRITYEYELQYFSMRSQWERAFGRLPTGSGGSTLLPAFRSGTAFSMVREFHTTAGDLGRSTVGSWDVTGERFGGWTFGVHHRYSPRTRTLFLGTGERRFAQDVGTVAPRHAGTGEPGDDGDGGSARLARLTAPEQIAIGPDGSLFVADRDAHRVRKIDPAGVITTVAGSGEFCDVDGCGDGDPAVQATFFGPSGVAVRPNGNLLIADSLCVREVGADGIIQTVAGFCDAGGGSLEAVIQAALRARGTACDDCPALDTLLLDAKGLAISPGGGYHLADAAANQIRYIGADDIITTLAGDGSFGSGGDGGPAGAAQLAGPSGISVGPNGEILIADTFNHKVRLVDRDGTIRTAAGTGSGGYSGDGGPSTSARLFAPGQVAAAADGSFLVADEFNGRVRRVSPGGRIETVAGGPVAGTNPPAGGYALQVPLGAPRGVAVDRSGAFYVADAGGAAVLWVGDARPVQAAGEHWIPSSDGQEIWIFDERGRHLETRHALTGATLLTFGYDPDGLLVSISDADGNVTTVERDGSGDPTAIEGPYGQSTTITLDAFDHLESLTDPAGHSWGFTSPIHGLLTSLVDPNTHETTMGYTLEGRLSTETDAADGTQSFVRSSYRESGLSWSRVRHTSAENRIVDYETWQFGTGERRWSQLRTGTNEWLVTRTDRLFDGTRVVRPPDGSLSVAQERSDPIWGAQASTIGSSSFSTPGGVSGSATTTSEVALSDPLDPLSLVSRTETLEINGRAYTATYEAAFRRWTLTSPEGRQRVLELDEMGRPISARHGNLYPVSFGYDLRGRLEAITQGVGADERVVGFGYDGLGRIETVTDPLLRQVVFTYDDANRVETQSLPGNRQILFGWDDKGNLASLSPPGRPAHGFTYTPVDRTDFYNPPSLGPGTWSTDYDYDLDRKVSHILRPDGLTIDFGYDDGRRLETITSPRGTTTIDYEPGTGHLESITTPEGNVLVYQMDGPLVETTTWSGEVAGSVERTYDENFRVETISVNGANPIAYGYDDDGLITQAGNLVLERDPATGFLTDTTLGVVTTHYDYSDFGELEAMIASVSGTPMYTTSYVRDDLGRIATKVEMIDGETTTYVYGYDPAGRLDTVTIDGVLAADYDYDDNGNRLLKTTPGGSEAGVYDDQDRMTSYGDASFTYTRNGELLTKTDSAGKTTFDYDVFGNLLGVDLPIGPAIDYVVDARNRRIGKRVDGLLVQGFLWQGQLSPIAELDGSGSVVSRFVYATRINVPDYMIRGGSTYRILTDHLGTPRLVVDAATGAILQRIDYDEWGVVLQDTDPGLTLFGFAGGAVDLDSGLIRFGFRDAFANEGRATSKDPIGHASGNPNLFGWAGGDPVNRTDVYGLAQKCSRPLAKAGGILSALYPGPGSSERANRYNREPLHEQYWFDDGSNFGYFDDSSVRDDEGHERSEYLCEGRLLDDNTLLEAIANKSEDPGEYELIGPEQNNCQDWASEVMMEYERLRAERAKATGVDPELEYVWGRVLSRP